ncbi:MAG: sugar phosphate isomerase/epimerase family protein [Limnochordia bacterium]|jgi:L-ribulose-5-phosphate 3-epimerase
MKEMRLGVFVKLTRDIDQQFARLREHGFSTCQLSTSNRELFTDEMAEAVLAAQQRHEVEITALWCGWPGPGVWDFYEGPSSLGLVPAWCRAYRMEFLLLGSDFGRKIRVSDFITHVGFIPENPLDADYIGVVQAVRHVARHCQQNGQFFLFETGQETPITLKRTIQDVGLDNLGVNLDPANLLLYGKGNPVDALDILGEYVRGVHLKDGEYPTDGRKLGQEKPIGQGRVDFPALIAKLKQLNYSGALTIEREIKGEQQIKDILAGKEFIERLL